MYVRTCTKDFPLYGNKFHYLARGNGYECVSIDKKLAITNNSSKENEAMQCCYKGFLRP